MISGIDIKIQTFFHFHRKNHKNNLTVYIFRQKVQEIIYNSIDNDKKSFKKQIKNVLELMNEYNTITIFNNESEKTLFTTLCNDLYIVLSTFNSKNLYTISRHTTQSCQKPSILSIIGWMTNTQTTKKL